MKKKKGILKNIILIVLIIVGILFFIRNTDKSKLEIKKWNNIYNENNINIYYGDSENSKIKALDDVYRVKEISATEEKELDKVLKVVDILNEVVEFDDVLNSKKINAFDILEEKSTLKKASQRDMAIITRDLLLTIDIKARVGEFKKIKKNSNEGVGYYIIEYWSYEYNKWVMIDFRDKGYMEKDGIPLSAIEIISSLDKSITYVGKTKSRQYIKEFKKLLNTYTINIDNSTKMEKSNSYVTYVKDKKYINIKLKDKYIPPTVFTENEELFNRSPLDTEIGVDEKAYIILMKKEGTEVKSEDYIVGAFKDGMIMDKYYIRENNGDFREVTKYTEFKLENGNNILELSIDGENTIASIEIEYIK